jgi:hypothetical protein
VGLFEAARARLGLPSFYLAYFHQQLWPSMVQGRHHPVSSYGYYLPLLGRWYAAGLVLGPAAGMVAARGRKGAPTAWRLYLVGAVWLLTVVVGFSCMRQKYQWYLHAALPAWALLAGGGAAALPQGARTRLCQGITAAALAAAAVAAALALGRPQVLAPRTPACLAALHRLPPQGQPPGGPKLRLACCVGEAGWRERYVALFVHGAELVPCGAPAEATYTAAGWHWHKPAQVVAPETEAVPLLDDAAPACPKRPAQAPR